MNELETQNLNWIRNHPDSLLSAVFNVWSKLGSRPLTGCLLTVAAFLDLEDYSTHKMKELLDESSIFELDSIRSFIIVELYKDSTSRGKFEYPEHTFVLWRHGSQVWKIESWFMKQRPSKVLVSQGDVQSLIKATGLSCVYYLSK